MSDTSDLVRSLRQTSEQRTKEGRMLLASRAADALERVLRDLASAREQARADRAFQAENAQLKRELAEVREALAAAEREVEEVREACL